MATVNKDFRIKSGLIVEGANATVNGEDIITTGSSTDDLQEGTTNLYFTDERAVAAVGGSATDQNTPSTVVKRDTNGNFAAGQITANQIVVQTAGSMFEDSGFNIGSNTGNDLNLYGHVGVNITANNADIILNADGNVYKGSVSNANEVITQGRLDTYIGDGTVTGSTGNTITDRIATAKSEAITSANGYTDTAVAGLVDSAPALLDTLNELAAALGDSPDTITNLTTSIGEKVAKSGDTMTGELVLFGDPTQGNAAATKTYVDTAATGAYNDAVTAAGTNAQGYATTAETNAKLYADSLATNYEPAGAATTAINSLTTSDIEEGTNLYFTNTRAVDAITNATIYPTIVDINDYRREEATQQYVSTAGTVTAHTFYGNRSVKYLVRVVGSVSGTLHSQITELLVTVDGNNNVAVTEFGSTYTSETELATFTADYDMTQFRLRATTTGNGFEVIAAATVLNWAD